MRRPALPICAALAAALVAAAPAAAQDRPVLTVYTYDSFASEYGPGPELERLFEADCACDLEFLSLEDGGAILGRLRLEGAQTRADAVVGLDTNLTAEARATGLLAPHGLDPEAPGGAPLDLPVPWSDDVFVPYDWGYFAFVYDSATMTDPPASLRDLVEDSDAEILIQDPRTSTPGLGLMLWMKQVFGDGAAAAWETLRPRIVTVSAGWSEAYGLFLEGEAPLVLSYTTSPAYHVFAENEHRYRAAPFAEGHYMQVEVAAMTAAGDQPDLARRFLAFLASPAAQAVLPTTNWMYPAVATDLPPAFDDLVRPAHALLTPADEVLANRAAWLSEWLEAMSR